MKRADAEILTVDDLAELFACDKETAAARLNSGDLPGVKVGRGWIIPRQALFERLNDKAREEAAVRREQQALARQAGQQRGKTASQASPRLLAQPASALLPADSKAQKGRKRRIPPILPTPPPALTRASTGL